MTDALEIWTVYRHPDDFPHHFVARKFEVRNGHLHRTNQVIVGSSMTAVRRHLEQYRLSGTVMPRTAGDDPNVVETWL